MCLVVVFPGFERLLVNQTTTKHPIWYLFRKKQFIGDFNGHSIAIHRLRNGHSMLLERFTHIQKQRVVIATIGVLFENL